MVLGVVRIVIIFLSGTNTASIKPHDQTWNGLGSKPTHPAATQKVEDDKDHDDNQRIATLHFYI